MQFKAVPKVTAVNTSTTSKSNQYLTNSPSKAGTTNVAIKESQLIVEAPRVTGIDQEERENMNQ